ncbi:endonuclease III domain-containing protein [Candidatus Omnitrophota bacterium]
MKSISTPGTAIFLSRIYSLLYKLYGPRHWWPAKTAFEVCVGAILTQNTSWSNVEKAIKNLKKANCLRPDSLSRISLSQLAKLIRPCGYYNLKAQRLKSFLRYLNLNYGGSLRAMKKKPINILRDELLGIKGIGPETADSILLYALKKPVFVIDAYTKRIMSCLKICQKDDGYDKIQSLFMSSLPVQERLFNEYHALIVEHAKNVCKSKPSCNKCILLKRR